MLERRLDLWLPTYALTAPRRAYDRWARRGQLTHIIFLVCDHFEPRHGVSSEEQPFERLRAWHEGYAAFQQRCRDRFGTAPLHSWFYPPHHGIEHLKKLSEMVFDGLGEIELHYHHRDDTEESLRRDLNKTIEDYHRWGCLLESGDQPRTAFGFIHGDWALNNSRYGALCGVNNEQALLQELGCWGDFTMPSSNLCQSHKINSIYYGTGDPHKPKSHDWGVDAKVGVKNSSGFLLMQGPLGINWGAPHHPRIENASLTSSNWGRPDRIRNWLDCGVHVRGRPNWLFVKLHTHGAIEKDFDALWGDKAFEMHRVLNEQYNDGQRFRLHYVTARQAYNIAKAAENGEEGSPADWLDYAVKPQAHSVYVLDAPHHVRHCTGNRLTIDAIESDRPVSLRTRIGSIQSIRGRLRALDLDETSGVLRLEGSGETSEMILDVSTSFRLGDVEGAASPVIQDSGATRTIRLAVGARCAIHFGPRVPQAA